MKKLIKFVRLPGIQLLFEDQSMGLTFTSHGVVSYLWKAKSSMLIKIVCAIYTSDEEKCIATARQLMREGATSDSYRMFALVSNLCQSPVSWYTSGPAQKYILRQIKAMDEVHGDTESSTGLERKKGSPLDACVLMLYGHILFTSTSYTYALGKRMELTATHFN